VCHDDAECGDEGTARCQVPVTLPANGCGLGCTCPPAELIPCATHEACGTGKCFSGGPFGVGCRSNFCMPSCLDVPCGDGFICNDERECQAVKCDAGYTCPSGYHCALDAPYADAHGCEPLSCDQGSSCKSGYVCRPDAPNANAAGNFGCVVVRCDEPDGPVCPINADCLAENPGTGCATRTCDADRECDCGACVNGACAPRAGVCMTLSAAGG
jgi:hypothetical protein